MAGNVSNGGIGKSPVIDRINNTLSSDRTSAVSAKMSDLVCKRKGTIYQRVPISFSGCKKAFQGQISNRMKRERIKSQSILITRPESIDNNKVVNSKFSELTADTRSKERKSRFDTAAVQLKNNLHGRKQEAALQTARVNPFKLSRQTVKLEPVNNANMGESRTANVVFYSSKKKKENQMISLETDSDKFDLRTHAIKSKDGIGRKEIDNQLIKRNAKVEDEL